MSPVVRVLLVPALLACACRREPHDVASAAPPAPPSTSGARLVPEPEPDRARELALWVDEAPGDAACWLARQPAAPVLDGALAALATHPDVLVPRPAFAADQAARIADADLRLAAVAEVLSTWARIDVDAARARLVRLDRIADLERAHLHELLADAVAAR